MKFIQTLGMKTIGKMIILMFITAIFFIPAVSAVPPLPCEYYGQILVDGAPPPVGTVVEAKIDGQVRGAMTTGMNGALGGLSTFDTRLIVSATERDIDITPNPIVNFTVNGVCTNGFTADIFSSGETRKIELSSQSLKPFPSQSLKPTDPDRDGLFEDLNANNRKDFNDVVLMFNQMQWISANEPVCAFDFNGNGRIDFNDIVKLFGEI